MYSEFLLVFIIAFILGLFIAKLFWQWYFDVPYFKKHANNMLQEAKWQTNILTKIAQNQNVDLTDAFVKMPEKKNNLFIKSDS